MRACYFWARLYPQAREALRRHLPDAELVHTGGGDGNYWRELAARWDDGGDLLVIEHDIIVHSQVRPQFESCPADWCEFRYPVRDGSGAMHSMSLGCTRFSAALRRKVPAGLILAVAGTMPILGRAWQEPGVLRWPWIDEPVKVTLQAAGYACCTHWPAVGHVAHRDQDEAVLDERLAAIAAHMRTERDPLRRAALARLRAQALAARAGLRA